jgi:heavy metal sensor kinase
MSLKKLLRLRHTLAFRLTLWYAFIFTVSFLFAFLVFYLVMTSVIQRRTDQDLLAEATEFSSIFAQGGIDAVATAMHLEADSEGVNKMFLRLLAPNGQEFTSSDVSSWGTMVQGKAALERLTYGGSHVFETVSSAQHRHKARILYSVIGPGRILQIGLSLKDDERLMEDFKEIFGTTLAVVLVCAVLVGWFMARRALLGVEELTQTAVEISNGALEKRVPMKARGEEIDALATAFNNMLDRIHALINGMREMTDNIAHDLRSHITRIRGNAEMTLTSAKPVDECEMIAANIIEECDRLLDMMNAMLDISEAEAGASKLTIERVDMVKVVREACELFQPVAEDKGVTIVSQVSAKLFVYGDIQKLQRMIANLLDNALKYTPSGGTVTISVNGDEEQMVVSVNDTGIGISRDDLPNIFRRFFRCDQSRSGPGIGLGLSLAIAIARAHGGDIAAASNPGHGSTFTVTLPLKPLSQ